jgi:hypothetical protein
VNVKGSITRSVLAGTHDSDADVDGVIVHGDWRG